MAYNYNLPESKNFSLIAIFVLNIILVCYGLFTN